MTLGTAESILHQLADFERNPAVPYPAKLDRARHLLALCGDPQNSGFRSILIAGSKGKGSAAAMMESVLRRSGLRTGLYTSPHLSSWRERVRVDGVPITEVASAEIAARLGQILSSNEFPCGAPTYFEALTALAFLHFKESRVDVAVLEVGLGGEYDATNVADPDVSVIMPIGLEHQNVLGHTLSEIAAAKAGVLRAGRPGVLAVQPDEALEKIRAVARERGAELFETARRIRIIETETAAGGGQSFFLEGPWGIEGPFEIPLLGRHQLENAAAAYAALKIFSDRSIRLAGESMRRGFADVEWPARLETVSDRPRVVIDGAHTRESAAALAAALKKHFRFRGVTVVLGMARDKDAAAFAAALAPLWPRFVCAGTRNPRAFAPDELARRVSDGMPGAAVEEAGSFESAFETARHSGGEEDLILVTGSLYLCAEAREFFGRPGIA